MAEGNADDNRFVKRMCFSSGNLSANWKLFEAQLNIYKIAKKFADMTEDERIANALLLMGSESVPIYEQFVFNDNEDAERKTLANVLIMFRAHCEPVKNVVYERMKFNSMRQGELTIHQFITALQSQADVCEYGDMRNDLVRDRIVVGVSDQKLREYLIDVDNLTLPTCIQKAKQYVSHHDHAKRMENADTDNLDALSKRGRGTTTSSNTYTDTRKTSNAGGGKTCAFCGKEPHKRDRCPARFSVCHSCKQKGHWAKSRACKGQKGEKTKYDNQNDKVNETTGGMDGLFLGSESE
jgi:hypothetical protein